MATVHIPAPLRDICGGASVLMVEASTLGGLLRALDGRCPGLYGRVVDDGSVRPELSIAIDGEAAAFGLHEPLAPDADVTIIPAIAGGRR